MDQTDVNKLLLLDEVVSRFERALREGRSVSVEHTLAASPADLAQPDIRSALLRELLTAELEYRRGRGRSVAAEEYRKRFPDDRAAVDAAFAGLPVPSSTDDTESLAAASPADTILEPAPSGTDRGSATELPPTRVREPAERLPREVPDRMGRYEMVRMLGRGGMGAVYLARDKQLDRPVAVKIPEFAGDPEQARAAVERFYREARSMATVEHPNLCPIHDVGEFDGRPYLTMSYIEGATLAERVAGGQPVSTDEAVRIVRKLAHAVQAIHDAGVVHRDLKPANVMINARDEPVVMDFGLASRDRDVESDLTHTGMILGSPSYMAPEQVAADHDRVGPRTDVYALGVILYQLLTGRRPFEGSGLAVLGEITSGAPPAPPSTLANIDSELEALCLRAMARDEADRFPSAADFASALTSWFDRNAAADGGVTRRQRRVTATAAVLGVIVLLGLAWAGVSIQRGDWFSSSESAVATSGDDVAQQAVELSATPKTGEAGSTRFGHDLLPPVPTPSKPSTGDLCVIGQEFGQAQARAVAAGDVDQDGDVDLWVAYDGTPGQLWLNDGTGQFSVGQEFDTAACDDVQLGDLDADGDLDAFTIHQQGPGAIWRNDGHGEFEHFSEIDLSCPTCVALGDIDNDGDLDAVVGGADESPANRILFNDGDADFQDRGQRLGTSKTRAIALADLDADGDLDIFASSQGGGNEVWQNDGHGTFSDTGQRLGDKSYRRVALVDMDHDGDIDACVAARNAPSCLWINDGRGWFSHCELTGMSTNAYGVAVADFDGDGQQDVLLGNLTVDSVTRHPNQLLLHDEAGWEVRWLHSEATWDVAVADFDNDGDLDAFLANSEDQPSQLWLNRDLDQAEPPRPFSFRDSGQRLGQTNSNDVELGDLDGDGDLDAVVANTDGQACIAWMNDGKGQFSAGTRLSEPIAAADVALGDIDGDGDPDVFLTNRDGANRIGLNDSRGQLELTDQHIGDSSSNQVLLADFDDDGDLDAWIGNFNPDHDRVWINDGRGHFTDSGQLLGSDRTYAVHCVDVDGNGTLDVFVGTGVNAPNVLWLNDGKGRFTKSKQALSGTAGSNGFAHGDLNGDGFPDLYESGWRQPDRIWINDGQGQFTLSQTPPRCLRSRRCRLADLDGDGDLDVVVGNERRLPDMVRANDGNGTFSDPVQLLGSEDTTGVAVGDLDGDGDIDIFAASYGNSPNRVWLNQRFSD